MIRELFASLFKPGAAAKPNTPDPTDTANPSEILPPPRPRPANEPPPPHRHTMSDGTEIRVDAPVPGLFEAQINRGDQLLCLYAAASFDDALRKALAVWEQGWEPEIANAA